MIKPIALAICILLSLAWPLNVNAKVVLCENKRVLGRVEHVLLLDNNAIISAKLDTGANSSSLSATHIAFFIRNNKTYVQFTLSLADSKKLTLSEPFVRNSFILKRKEEQVNGEKYSKRIVVLLPIKIGNQVAPIEVNLTDRSDFRYPMLLGADALNQLGILVDVSARYLAETKD